MSHACNLLARHTSGTVLELKMSRFDILKRRQKELCDPGYTSRLADLGTADVIEYMPTSSATVAPGKNAIEIYIVNFEFGWCNLGPSVLLKRKEEIYLYKGSKLDTIIGSHALEWSFTSGI